MDLGTLTLIGLYFSDGLRTARARIEVAQAAVITAGTRPNPVVSAGSGHTESPASPFLLDFSLSQPIETADKRDYRIARTDALTKAAKEQYAGTVWQVRSRIRAPLPDHLLARRDVEMLDAEQRARTHELRLPRFHCMALLPGEADRTVHSPP